MNLLTVLVLTVGSPIAGVGLVQLQARLERWEYERHVEE